eukprot:SAG31_NODE_16881_length_691_cov_5.734797_1_plen_43_part_01
MLNCYNDITDHNYDIINDTIWTNTTGATATPFRRLLHQRWGAS